MTVFGAAFSELSRYTELRRRLVEIGPDIDDQTLLDTLEGATNLQEAIGCVVRSALDDEALADGLKLRLETMRERLDRIEATAAKKRQVALDAMEEADIEKVLEPDFTASLRTAPPTMVVLREPDIPEPFWLPQPAKLDRRSILEVLKSGRAVPGAELADTRLILAVRTK